MNARRSLRFLAALILLILATPLLAAGAKPGKKSIQTGTISSIDTAISGLSLSLSTGEKLTFSSGSKIKVIDVRGGKRKIASIGDLKVGQTIRVRTLSGPKGKGKVRIRIKITG